MGIYCRHTDQEGDGLCVPDMKVFLCETPERTDRVKLLAEAGQSTHSETSSVSTRTERTLTKEEDVTPKATSKGQITVCKCT